MSYLKLFGYSLLISVLFLASCVNSDSEEKPNILFILVDDLGWKDLGFAGSSYYETPNVDRLADEGAVFTDAYAACPVCSPSRAAIMSGKYPARLNLTDYIPGNRHWGPHEDQQLASKPFKLQLELEEHTMAEAMKDAGYRTIFAGKWHIGEKEKYFPEHQGFDINIGGNNTGHPAGGYFSPYKNTQLPDGPNGEYLTDRLTDELISIIEQPHDKPFFAFLSFYTVHLPMQGKPEKAIKYQDKLSDIHSLGVDFVKHGSTWHANHQNVPQYAAMVESMDENIGRILSTLDSLQITENTLVIFTSDNGGMATSNRTDNIPTSNLPLRAGKGYLYEGGIRVPLIFRYPGKIEAGTEFSKPVTGTDLYPSILDIVGLDQYPIQHTDGISLKPLLEGQADDDRPIFWHYPHYSGGLGGKPSGAVRMGDYKLIEFYEDHHVELYDLKADLGEKNNLADANSSKAEELRKMLEDWRHNVSAQMPYPNPHFK